MVLHFSRRIKAPEIYLGFKPNGEDLLSVATATMCTITFCVKHPVTIGEDVQIVSCQDHVVSFWSMNLPDAE